MKFVFPSIWICSIAQENVNQLMFGIYPSTSTGKAGVPIDRRRSQFGTWTIGTIGHVGFVISQSPTTYLGRHSGEQPACFFTQIAQSIQLAAIENHLTDTSYIFCCREQSCISRYAAYKCSRLI